ncbi:hypothetical protein OH76DRAFT_1210607 [Lentinus brumalis]|uniref:Uncharacterized protein n=1 Tax=Lentinus brumalis TaxID=2498619 RepID=A0A371DLC6_9APHY|nr:hypothetical protein OH76DRAFT_1210607 [Polyporus brumalis]
MRSLLYARYILTARPSVRLSWRPHIKASSPCPIPLPPSRKKRWLAASHSSSRLQSPVKVHGKRPWPKTGSSRPRIAHVMPPTVLWSSTRLGRRSCYSMLPSSRRRSHRIRQTARMERTGHMDEFRVITTIALTTHEYEYERAVMRSDVPRLVGLCQALRRLLFTMDAGEDCLTIHHLGFTVLGRTEDFALAPVLRDIGMCAPKHLHCR